MSLLSGSITFRKFRVQDKLPRNFKETMVQRLPRYAFREINPQTNPEMSIGWVNANNLTDTDLALEKVLFGKYVILGLRKDRKSLSGAMLKAKFNEMVKAHLRERRVRKLPKEEMASLRETIRTKMLAEISPATAVNEMVWNYETNEVYFSGTATKICGEFADLFTETFELALVEATVASATSDYIDRETLRLELGDIEPAHFAG